MNAHRLITASFVVEFAVRCFADAAAPMCQRITTFSDDVPGDYGASGYITADGWFLHSGAILRERKPHETRFPVDTNVSARINQGGYLANGPSIGANDRGLDSVALRARVSYGADGHTPYDPSGFAWENYRLIVSNILVSAISDGNPYVQVMAAYKGPGDYIAVRLTQTATIDSQRGYLPRVRQDLIRVANGVENVLSTTFTRKWNNGRGINYLTTNEGDSNNLLCELSYTPQGPDWVVDIDMTSGGIVRARAFIPGGGSWTNNWLIATGVSTTGTVSFDTFDARANFRNIYVVRDGVSSPVDTANWYLGGTQAGDSSATRWILETPPGKLSQYHGVARPVPTLPFTIGVAKAGESATLPEDAPYETVGEASSIASLSYANFSRSIRYWGNAFVRIQPGVSDARLVVDDIEVCVYLPSSVDVAGISIPVSYFDTDYPALLAAHGGDYAAAAIATAANGVNKVWECYVAGIDPTDETAEFMATINMVDGQPQIRRATPLSAEEETKREYRTLGKRTLDPNEEWADVTDVQDLNAAGYRFFKARVLIR